MKKISIEIDVPDWANWIAQDLDGVLCVFENKPKTMDPDDYNGWTDNGGNFIEVAGLPKNRDWMNTLKKLPLAGDKGDREGEI